MTALYVLVALVSGYILNFLHFPFRCLQSRSNGWDYYFRIAVSGSFLAFLALVYVLKYPLNLSILENNEALPFYWAFICLVLAVSVGSISSLLFNLIPSLRIKIIAKYASRNHFDDLVMQSALLVETVLVCLKSGRCVVGVCYPEASFETGESSNIAIYPLLSGYRKKEDFELKLKQNDLIHLRNTRQVGEDSSENILQGMKMVVAKSEIESISKFDLDVYMSSARKV